MSENVVVFDTVVDLTIKFRVNLASEETWPAGFKSWKELSKEAGIAAVKALTTGCSICTDFDAESKTVQP